MVAVERTTSPPPAGRTPNSNVPTPPPVTLVISSSPGAGRSASVNVQITVSPASRRIDTVPAVGSAVTSLPPPVHASPVSRHPAGTISLTVHGGSPARVSAR